MCPKYLVLKSSSSPENKSYNRFAPPSAQAFQEDAFQSFHRSPREKGWLSKISAYLLDELSALVSSRKDGTHLRFEVIVGVRDRGEVILRGMSGFMLRLPPSSLHPIPNVRVLLSSQDGQDNRPLLCSSNGCRPSRFRHI